MVDLEKHQTSIASIQHFLYPWNVVADSIQGGKEYDCNGLIIPGLFEPSVRSLRFFRKYPFSAFKHCHAYSIIIVVFLQEIIR